jgi:hypothetical protein
MRLTKSIYQVRLTQADHAALTEILEDLSKEDRERLTALEDQHRVRYRNNGRKPTPLTLVLRRAIHLGLPLVAKETED